MTEKIKSRNEKQEMPGGELDVQFMEMAIRLAELGRGSTGLNPLVGAVVSRDSTVLGEGYHERLGGPHAEVNAIDACRGRLVGATLYVTLEPCVHWGRTPPCVERVISSGVSRVVVGMEDPNPMVGGRGIKTMRDAGLEVEVGVMEEQVRKQNEVYLKWMGTGLPYVTFKMAMTLDGRTATSTGDSKWISSEASRRDVHRLRACSDAIMVGAGTVVKDDPLLTVRMGQKTDRQPLRVIVATDCEIDADRNVVRDREASTLVAVGRRASAERIAALREVGVTVEEFDRVEEGVNLRSLLEYLAGNEVAALLVEGGPSLGGSLWKAELIDRIIFYIAPIISGGGGSGPFEGEGANLIAEAHDVEIEGITEIGGDIKVVARPIKGNRGR